MTAPLPHTPTDPVGAGIWAALVFYTHRPHPKVVRATTSRTLGHLLSRPATTSPATWGTATATAALTPDLTLLERAAGLTATQMERHLTQDGTPLWLLTSVLTHHTDATRLWHHWLHTHPTQTHPHPQPYTPAAGPAATRLQHPIVATQLTSLYQLLHPPARDPEDTPPAPHLRADTAYQLLRNTLDPAHVPYIHQHHLPSTPPTQGPTPDAHQV